MLRVFKQLLLQEIVVSSANSINDSNLLLFSMSFIYIDLDPWTNSFSAIAEKELVQGSILAGHLSLRSFLLIELHYI